MKQMESYKIIRWEELNKGLKLWELELLRLRTMGYKYTEIAEKLNVNFRSKKIEKFTDYKLRQLIYKGGRLFEQYIAYYELIAEESTEEARRIIDTASSTAAMTLVSLLGKENMGHVRLGASEAILDRTLGKPTQAISLNNDDKMMQELEDKINSIFDEDRDDALQIADRIKRNANKQKTIKKSNDSAINS
jgi:hypothetical protein